jgi:hypothetical protein
MTQIVEVALNFCKYNKNRRVLLLSSKYVGMPQQLFISSHHTGKEVRFVVVSQYDVLFDQDQWDGEQQVYRPVGTVPGVDHMVIHHG